MHLELQVEQTINDKSAGRFHCLEEVARSPLRKLGTPVDEEDSLDPVGAFPLSSRLMFCMARTLPINIHVTKVIGLVRLAHSGLSASQART